MFISRPLYELKPYALILGGSICVLTVEHPVAIIAGLILAGIGGLIFKMRKNSRSRGLT